MKKGLLFAAVICLITTYSATAQTEKGDLVIGGASNLDLSSTNDGSRATSELGLDFTAGYFVIDNLAFGPSVDLLSSKNGEFRLNSSSIGLYGRYYVDNVFFGASYSIVSSKFDSSGSETRSTGSQFGLELGYAIFVSDHVALQPSLNYSVVEFSRVSLRELSLNLGISFYL